MIPSNLKLCGWSAAVLAQLLLLLQNSDRVMPVNLWGVYACMKHQKLQPSLLLLLLLQDFDRVMSVNVRGVYACMKHEIPLMLATAEAPAIVVTASVAGHSGFEHASVYAVSKWAVRGLVATAAKEYGKVGLR